MTEEKHYYLCLVWFGKKTKHLTKQKSTDCKFSCRLITERIFPHKNCLESMGKKENFISVGADARVLEH